MQQKQGEFVVLERLDGFEGFVVKAFVGATYFGFQESDGALESYSISEIKPTCYSKNEYLDLANQLIPGGKLHHKMAGVKRSIDLKGYFAKTKPHFNFNNEENTRGFKFLKSLGKNPDNKFICLNVRDSSYKEKYGDKREYNFYRRGYRISIWGSI